MEDYEAKRFLGMMKFQMHKKPLDIKRSGMDETRLTSGLNFRSD